MKLTFTRKNEFLVECDVCGWVLYANVTKDETASHRHISLEPFDARKSKIVWHDKRYAIFQVKSDYEYRLVREMCYIGKKNGDDSFLCESVREKTHYVMVMQNEALQNVTIIGYVSFSTENRIINNKQRSLPTCRQITILPDFRNKGYGKFLLLKPLELRKALIFAVDSPNEYSAPMIERLMKKRYLRLTHTTGFGGGPGFIFEVLKCPTVRLIKAKRAERILVDTNRSANEALRSEPTPFVGDYVSGDNS